MVEILLQEGEIDPSQIITTNVAFALMIRDDPLIARHFTCIDHAWPKMTVRRKNSVHRSCFAFKHRTVDAVPSIETPTPPLSHTADSPMVSWSEGTLSCHALWQSVQGWAAPSSLIVADDSWSADRAYRLVSGGTSLVWRGDFHQGKQLLAALKRRLSKQKAPAIDMAYPARFHLIRQARSQNARTLGRLLIPIDKNYQLTHRRAPAIAVACQAALETTTGGPDQPAIHAPAMLMPLTELVGILSAHEWQRRGLTVAALGHRVHPRYGVFAPTRHEYLDLIARAPLPAKARIALDVGTGTGIIAAMLANRGLSNIVATDTQAAALQCATDNMTRLELSDRVEIVDADLFAPGQYDLIVCNPPWLPGRAKNALEAAIYDPDSRMLNGFLAQARSHLTAQGHVWLILSDLAEHLQLRTRQTLLDQFAAGGLRVLDRLDIKAQHSKLSKAHDPLADIRQREITSLWRLTLAEKP